MNEDSYFFFFFPMPQWMSNVTHLYEHFPINLEAYRSISSRYGLHQAVPLQLKKVDLKVKRKIPCVPDYEWEFSLMMNSERRLKMSQHFGETLPERPTSLSAAGCHNPMVKSLWLVTCWVTVWSHRSAWGVTVQETRQTHHQGEMADTNRASESRRSRCHLTVSWKLELLTELVWWHPQTAAASWPATF